MYVFIPHTDDDFDWTRLSGGTSSDGTGPNSDHTGHGSYIYIETSDPRQPGDKAELMSPVFQYKRFVYVIIILNIDSFDYNNQFKK